MLQKIGFGWGLCTLISSPFAFPAKGCSIKYSPRVSPAAPRGFVASVTTDPACAHQNRAGKPDLTLLGFYPKMLGFYPTLGTLCPSLNALQGSSASPSLPLHIWTWKSTGKSHPIHLEKHREFSAQYWKSTGNPHPIHLDQSTENSQPNTGKAQGILSPILFSLCFGDSFETFHNSSLAEFQPQNCIPSAPNSPSSSSGTVCHFLSSDTLLINCQWN